MKKIKIVSREIVKNLNKEKRDLIWLMKCKCADCVCWFADPYEKCEIKECPLFKYYPTRGDSMVLKKLKGKFRKND